MLSTIFSVLMCALFSMGAFLVAADYFRIPYIKTSKAIGNLAKKQKHKTSGLDLWLEGVAEWLAKHLRLNQYKKLKLEGDLRTANMNISPEMHTATSIVKALVIFVIIIPLYFIFPILIPFVALLAFLIYLNEINSINNKIKDRREAIEYELPGLVFKIERTLLHSRDVLSIIDSYRDIAGDELKSELDITVADMRSDNYENALKRLELRVGSVMMSDITRGLISVVGGDDTASYWAMLSTKFAEAQRQMLRRQATKIPSKVKKLSMALLFCFMAIFIVVIIFQIIDSMGVMMA